MRYTSIELPPKELLPAGSNKSDGSVFPSGSNHSHKLVYLTSLAVITQNDANGLYAFAGLPL